MMASFTIIKKIDTPVGSVSLLENNILLTDTTAKVEIDLVMCEEIHKVALEVTGGKAYPNLFTFTKYVIPDVEARNFMLLPKRLALTSADAFVIQSLPQKIIGNFYLRINKPPIPTKFFSTEEEAVKWLLQFT